MRITFDKQTIRITNTYRCQCGHKFSRVASDYYTVNPFLTEPIAVIRENITEKLRAETRDCPKCKKTCKPANQ